MAVGCICPPTSELTCRNEDCPRKSQVERAKPTVDLNHNTVTILGRTIRMTPLCIEAMASLVSGYPNVVRTEKVYTDLYGGEWPDNVRVRTSAHMWRLRQMLKGIATIEVYYKRGYRLVLNLDQASEKGQKKVPNCGVGNQFQGRLRRVTAKP